MTVGFLGAGVMGGPMAVNLARAGFDVSAWNRTASKAEALAAHGVRPAVSPAAAAAGAELLVTMLADGAATEQVLAEGEGALGRMGSGGIWVQMGTVGAPAADRLGGLAAEHGVTYVDAPVMGSREPAEAGELVVLASGPTHAHERCAGVFDAVGRQTLWIGPAGAGSRLKVVVNAWLMSTTAALAETLALASSLGIDPGDFLDATDQGALVGAYANMLVPTMAARRFPLNFPLELAAKDARLALEAAGEGARNLRVFAATYEQFLGAVNQGRGSDDWAAVIHAALSDS